MLLVAADLYTRRYHEVVLRSAGYEVRVCTVCPEPADLHQAAIVLSDVAWFEWLRQQSTQRHPPIVVVADDERGGMTACLCGALA